MNKPDVTKMLKTAQAFVSKRSPEILTGIGIVGMCTTVVLAVKATPKAMELIEEEKDRQNDVLYLEAVEKGHEKFARVDRLKPVEVVKVAWKPYIPAAVTGVVSIACIVGASSVNARRQAALYSAYKLSETAFAEYKDKVVETIGEKKEKVVKDKVAAKKVEENPVSNNTVIVTEKGNTLCYDAAAGRYFRSDIDKIKAAVNEINRRMVYDQYVSLNEFYDELGLEHTDLGNELGWNLDKGLVDVDFSSQIADDGTPCIVISYNVAPRYDFSKLM